ncbi:hypothetical protein WJX77_000326 [Trebouxia sp. C0004]
MSGTGGVARGRLTVERKNWRKDHPYGFVAKPITKADGSVDLLHWKCTIPGKAGTIWEKGLYPVDLVFTESYPSKPPECRFPKGFFHPNVYPTGLVCLSIVNADNGWKPAITVKQILTGIQEMLSNPNNSDPAQEEAYRVLRKDKAAYEWRVKAQVQNFVNNQA